MKDYQKAQEKFDTTDAAQKYLEQKHAETWRNKGEEAAMERCLDDAPSATSIIDIPCGTFRLAKMLRRRKYKKIIAADYAASMVEVSRREYEKTYGGDKSPDAPEVVFMQMDINKTGLPDNHVDVVLCNRLFHHYNNPETRVAVLKEISRIARDLVIISCFRTGGFSHQWRELRCKLGLKKKNSRYAVSIEQIKEEAARANLEVIQINPAHFLSSQIYISYRKKK